MLISMLSSQYCSSDLQMSRLSHCIYSFGWTFKLRHLASKFCLLSEALSRIFDQEMLISGVPLKQKINQECDEFFETYKNSLPECWTSGEAEFTTQDLFDNLTYQICRDHRISENCRDRRFKSLLQRVHESFKPQVQRFPQGHPEGQWNSKNHVPGWRLTNHPIVM